MNKAIVDAATATLLALSGDPSTYEAFKAEVAKLLHGLDPKKPYGTALFDALARTSWSIAFEAVAIRTNKLDGQVEVYLRQRAADDTAYPSQWHAPGSVMRPGERPRNVADRLENEFGARIERFTPVSSFYFNEARGSFLHQVHIVELGGVPFDDERHKWFPVERLPKVMPPHHEKLIIPAALSYFFEHYSNLLSNT